MGEIVGAGLLAHVPTIVLPDDIRRELNDGNESTLYTGLHQLKREVFDVLKPDLVIVFDSHWFTTVEFVITSAERRLGFYTSDELPRGMSSVPYDVKGDPEFAKLVGEIAKERENAWVTPIDNEHLPIAYATTNFLGFLQGEEAWVTVSTCQTSEAIDFQTTGEIIGEAIRRSDRRVVLIASGALSHTFHTLRTLRNHEAAPEEHIFSDEARKWDHQMIDWMLEGNHKAIIDNMGDFMKVKPEGRFGHFQMMVHALGGEACTAKGRMYSNYENSIGTGQVHVWFDQPENGWTA
jgi:aromatic ring-opening dioxygenase catalytic subunit (LigB family)